MIDLSKVDTLVFAGGGVRGLSYASCLAEFASMGLDFWSARRTIKTVCGCSIGAMAAAFVTVGVTPKEFNEIARSRAMESVVSVDVRLLLSEWGLDSGEKLQQWIDHIIEAKVGKANITLKECHALTGINFEVVVTNLNLDKVEYISHENSPMLTVSEAVVMSMSLPPVFSPRKWKCMVDFVKDAEVSDRIDAVGAMPADGDPIQIERGGSRTVGIAENLNLVKRVFDVRVEREYLVVDGGLRCNYPMMKYDGPNTIGFRLLWKNAFALNGIDRYISRVASVALSASEQADWRTISERARSHTVLLDVGDVSTLQFALTDEELESIMKLGKKAARTFAEAHGIGIADDEDEGGSSVVKGVKGVKAVSSVGTQTTTQTMTQTM